MFAERIEPVRLRLKAAAQAIAEAVEAEEDARDEFFLDDAELDDTVKTAFERAGQYDRESPGERVQERLFPEGGFTPITRANAEKDEPDLVDQLGPIALVLATIGLASHYESIACGVLDSRDIIYYICVTAVLLHANVILAEHRRS